MESLIKLDWWYDKLVEQNLADCPKIMIGTKLDLAQKENKQYRVDTLIVEQFRKNHGVKDYINTSSKENTNVLKSFKEMVRKILDFHDFDYVKIL